MKKPIFCVGEITRDFSEYEVSKSKKTIKLKLINIPPGENLYIRKKIHREQFSYPYFDFKDKNFIVRYYINI